MFNIRTLFLSVLADIIGKEEIVLSIEENSTIKIVLEMLIERFGKQFKNAIFISQDTLNKYIIIGVNGKDIRSLNNLNTLIREGDEVVFLPAIAGG